MNVVLYRCSPILWITLLTLLVSGSAIGLAPESTLPITHPRGAAIASPHALATQAGMQVLRAGGNAFDAAVAVSSTLSVVEPISSGLGGGGFFLLHDGKTGKDIFIEKHQYIIRRQ